MSEDQAEMSKRSQMDAMHTRLIWQEVDLVKMLCLVSADLIQHGAHQAPLGCIISIRYRYEIPAKKKTLLLSGIADVLGIKAAALEAS